MMGKREDFLDLCVFSVDPATANDLLMIHCMFGWFMVDGLWFMVYGLWFMVDGLWLMVYGLWFMVDG